MSPKKVFASRATRPLCTEAWRATTTCVASILGRSPVLPDITVASTDTVTASSTSTNFYKSMNGTGVLSPKSSTFATSLSRSP